MGGMTAGWTLEGPCRLMGVWDVGERDGGHTLMGWDAPGLLLNT